MIYQPLFPSLSVGVGASVIAHVGLLVAVSRGPAAARAGDSADRADSRVEIEVAEPLETPAAEPLDGPAAPPALGPSGFQHHHHVHRASLDHDAVPRGARVERVRHAPAMPVAVSGPVIAEVPLVPRAVSPAVPRFLLSTVGQAHALGSPVRGGATMAGRPLEPSRVADVLARGDGGGRNDGGESADGIVAESRVSERARLLSSAPATYPLAARQREVEADVPLEIVVDTTGRVTSSRALAHGAYGLDQAALDAMARYRFSPAQRDGHPVRVRMRWVVQFRLR